MKVLRRHILASLDIDEAIVYYLENAPEGVADRFLDEVEHALEHIAHHPGTGSKRYANTSNIAELRFWTLNRFPFAVFYTEHSDHIAVLRVLHQSSDLPHHLT